jgi:hypothetical protein
MLVGRCSSELSSHKLQAKSKKSQAPSEAEGSAVSLAPKPMSSQHSLQGVRPSQAWGKL